MNDAKIVDSLQREACQVGLPLPSEPLVANVSRLTAVGQGGLRLEGASGHARLLQAL